MSRGGGMKCGNCKYWHPYKVEFLTGKWGDCGNRSNDDKDTADPLQTMEDETCQYWEGEI